MHVHNHSTDDKAEILALVKYMAGHNESHTKELESLCDKVAGINESALDMIEQAVGVYNQGNELLNKALELLEKGE